VTGTPHPPTAKAADPAGAEAHHLLHDDRLTAFGLLHETHTGALAVVGPELESFGFTLSTFEVMLRLARSPEHRLRMAELTAQCTITSSGLTRVVDRLEAAGHVVREPCASDRRGFYAVLTPRGLAELLAALPAHLETLDRSFCSVLTAEEMDAFLSSMRKIRSVVFPQSDPALTTGVR
jgi:DNA-binding MarR family transcriptional regulator